MIESHYNAEIDNERAKRRFYEKICIGLLAANMILGLVIANTDIEERTTFVPPMIDKKFWIKGDQTSREYLEMMAEWLAGLPLSVTPNSVESRNAIFLRYIAPSSHAQIKAQFDLQAERIKRENISTIFYPVSFQTNLSERQVAITGDFITIVSGVPAPAVRRTWRLTFKQINSTYWLSEFKEVERDQAFTDDRVRDISPAE